MPPLSVSECLRILGMTANCSITWNHVKQAFSRQSLLHHPDKGGSSEAFRDLREAFNELKRLHEGNLLHHLICCAARTAAKASELAAKMEAAEAAVRRAQDDLAACDLIFAEDRLASLRVVRHPEGGAEENAEENDGYFFVPHDEEGSLDRVRCTHEYLKHGNVKVVARAWSDAVRAALRRGAGRLVVRSSDADDGSDCVDIVLVDPLFPPDAFRDAPPPRPAGAAGRHGRTVTLTTKLSPRGGAWDQVRQVWYVGPDGELELLEVVLIGSSRAVPAAVRAHMAREARRTAERGRSMNTRQARHHDAKASRLASTAAGLERAAIAAETLTPEAAEIVTPEILLADAEAHRRMAAWLSGLAAQLRALPAERHPADAANVSADASVGGPGQASEGVCDAFARFRREFLRAEATEWEENAAAGTPLRHRGVVDEPFIYVRDGGFAATRT